MERREAPRRLIVNADDFGRSHSINQAVIRAHREGILTTASLMVNEPAFAEAVELARQNPALGVGLHLTLCCGHATLPRETIPGLVNSRGEFSNSPAQTGWRYFFSRDLRPQLAAELAAQLQKFRATGLPLDHVNGHLHLHLHPRVLAILMELAIDANITRVRLTRDPFWLSARLVRGHWLYRVSHAVIHHWLSHKALPVLRRNAIRHTDLVFGLLQNGRVDEDYLRRILTHLPPGDSELYSHPSLDQFENEFAALVSPAIKALIVSEGVRLIRYRDL
jgi:hopanoid biosynthesis associated protein HpnK